MSNYENLKISDVVGYELSKKLYAILDQKDFANNPKVEAVVALQLKAIKDPKEVSQREVRKLENKYSLEGMGMDILSALRENKLNKKGRPMKIIDLYKKHTKLSEETIKLSIEEKKAFLARMKEFASYGNLIYRNQELGRVAEEIGELIEMSNQISLQETGDGWFDEMTVKRHNKQLESAYKVFQKTTNEVRTLQQRMEAAYEDMAEVFKKYYDL